MGVVYAAYDPKLDRRVALKVLRARDRGDDSARARLLREARAIARLSHPNVVSVYDVGLLKNGIYFSMEYVPGRTLSRWLADEKPDWPQVVEVMLQAGRGLAAAHASGLVHRDFKPANVIVGEDGRVRVLDFGLARTTEAHEPNAEESSELEHTPELTREEYSSQTPVTRDGMVVGTPVYMSPEQYRNQADERSDQYSFCVALYEGLYRVRPFSSRNRRVVRQLTLRGKFDAPPADAKVPARYQTIIERGMSLAPEDRYPSMNALLAALGRRRRNVWRIAAVAGVAAAVAGALVVNSVDRGAAQVCQLANDKLAGVWDEARKTKVRSAFTATRVAYQDTAFTTTAAALDRYSADWLAMHRETCLATEVRHEQSAQLLDLRMMCLHQRLDELRALTRQLASADARGVEKAVQASGALGSLSRCADARTLTAQVTPPHDPKVRTRIADARKQIAEASALRAAGKYGRALKAIESVVSSARDIRYAPLLGQALQAKGHIEISAGNAKASAKTLLEAYLSAVAGRDDHTALRAATKLVFAVGYRLGKHEQGHTWARTAKAILDRGIDDPSLEADVENNLAMVRVIQGRYSDAERHTRRALALQRRVFGDAHRDTGNSHHMLAVILKKRGMHQRALASYRRALAIHRAALGDSHPSVAMSLHNVGVVLKRLGDDIGAMKSLKRALASWERSLPKSHPNIGMALLNLGAVETKLGQFDKAREHLRRARTIKTRRLGAKHWSIAKLDLALGDVLRRQGKQRDALVTYQGALKQLEASLGGKHPEVAGALAMIAEVSLELADHANAQKAYVRALAIRESTNSNYRTIGDLRVGLGRVALATKQPGAAVPHLRQALAAYRKTKVSPTLLAVARFVLARALSHEPRRLDESRKLARQALAEFRGANASPAQIAGVERWLARTPTRSPLPKK